MNHQAAAMIAIVDTFSGKGASARQMNDDLAFHEMEQALNPAPGRLARMAAWIGRALAPRDMIQGTAGMSGHMLRDLGLDPMPTDPELPALRTEARQRPVVRGSRVTVDI